MEVLRTSPMDVDSSSNSTPENPLLNHLILARVLKNLDALDLVNSSRVNKLWFREGRKILKHRHCYARCGDDPCVSLRRLDRFLKKLDPNEIWYNGLYISVDSYWHWKDSMLTTCLKDYDEVAGCMKPKNIRYNNILKRFPLKYLKINWYGNEPLEKCPGALLIPKLLLHHRNNLEEIEVEESPFEWDWLYDDKDLRDGKLWLPKLKVIKGKPSENRAFSPKEIWKLVRVAPNLEDLLVCVTDVDLKKHVPRDRYNIIKSLCFKWNTNADIKAYSKFAQSEPKLRYLVIKEGLINVNENDSSDESDSNSGDDDDDDKDMDVDMCWETLERLFRSSRESLEMIELPVHVAATELDSDWQVFPKVKELSLETNLKEHKEELYIHEALRRFDFRTRFPNLTAVTLLDYRRENEDDPEDDDDDFENSVGDQPMLPLVYTANINHLTLKNRVTDFGLTYSSSLFPHVTKLDLSFGKKSNIPIPYGTIWREWPGLEVLSVREAYWGYCVNYDADFLGISKAEARRLRNMEFEDVKNLHIVPTKPAITTAKNLRQVTVNFTENNLYGDRGGEFFFLSRAACILTVQRMPNLKFKLICSNVHEGVMALRGYVEIENR